jgi:hypothetical protein
MESNLTHLYDDKIGFDDTSALTAFSRVRTADARLVFESRYMYGEGASTEFNDLIVGSGTLVADQPRNCYLANVTTSSGDRVVRQSKQYNPYISGTSNIGMISFTMNSSKTNLKQSVGLFDDLNGFIFRVNSLIPEFVVRKNGADQEIVPISSWNRDRFDGTKSIYNPSGLLIDFSKSHILIIDYQWLGVGRVRMGFMIDGALHIAHVFNHANMVTEVYTNQPSLPVRWEIENTGVTTSSSQLMLICSAVYCEGSDSETGFSRSVSTGATTVALTAANSNSGYGIIGIRLRNSLVGKPNHALARLKSWSLLSNVNMGYKIVILPNKSFLGNPSITWTKVPGFGWCEFIKDFALAAGWNTNNDYSVIVDDFVSGAAGNSSGQNSTRILDNRSNAIFQNYDASDSQIMVIVGYRMSQDASASASMNWVEVK